MHTHNPFNPDITPFERRLLAIALRLADFRTEYGRWPDSASGYRHEHNLAKEHARLTRATSSERLEDILVAVLGDEVLLHGGGRLSSYRPKQKMRRRAYNGSMAEFLAKLEALLLVRDQLDRWPSRSDSDPEHRRLAHFKMHLPRHKHADILAAIQERDEDLWAWVRRLREQRAA